MLILLLRLHINTDSRWATCRHFVHAASASNWPPGIELALHCPRLSAVGISGDISQVAGMLDWRPEGLKWPVLAAEVIIPEA